MPNKIHGRECSPSHFNFFFPRSKCTFIPVLNFIFYVSYCHYIWVHLLSTFFVVSFSNQESEWSCIWMFCILTLPFFHDFDIRFLEFFRWCGIFYFHFIFILYINSKSHNRNLQHGYLDKNKSLKMPVIRNRIL